MGLEIYRNKKILVTGHTGFKGSWLCHFLSSITCEVFGLSLGADEESMYNITEVNNLLSGELIADISNFKEVKDYLKDVNPDFVFHLAAQAIVELGYSDPIGTYQTNVIGTLNLLEAVRAINKQCVFISVATDKVYENLEMDIAFDEDARLGGHDPYSSSKAAMEIMVDSYRKSFLQNDCIKLASVRGGNVIGGGDFSTKRIIPDIYRSVRNETELLLRNPLSTRPWQHVLDALNGYLVLGEYVMLDQNGEYCESWNFGPDSSKTLTVEQLVTQFIKEVKLDINIKYDTLNTFHEAKFLRLNSDKANNRLKWKNKFDPIEAVAWSSEWYMRYIDGDSMKDFTKEQVKNYLKL